ncbi:MAG: hypothetical protein RJA34_2889 [Pseudomonadota bacterium]|jgi:NodT family efflux transporter outer membrane factor (OMF) lipoprotein
MKTPLYRTLISAAALTALSACSILMPPTQVSVEVAPQWEAPLPHQGTLTALSQWWQQQGDPVLAELVVAAQGVSPNVASALARLEASRASQVTAQAALMPKVDASVNASRGVNQPNVPAATALSAGFQASWELDLVGAKSAVSKAALAQLEGSQAQWHEARVAVAAEVANTYYSLATCQRLLEVARQDVASRAETARLAELSAKAGFTAPSVAALARASAADASSRVTQQTAACDLSVKALVALTALPEPTLRKKLSTSAGASVQAVPIAIASVPAQTLAQRPDVYAAEREVVVASAQVGSAQAQRYPRLTLDGSLGALSYTSRGTETNMQTWSFGPLALKLPVFDAGQRKANVLAAEAAYEQAVAAYRGKVRQAVREVEEALVNLQSTDARRADAEVATRGYAESLAATQARYQQGLVSLMELEDARRSALASQSAQVNLQGERNRAWVSLYRALGGGWDPATAVPAL